MAMDCFKVVAWLKTRLELYVEEVFINPPVPTSNGIGAVEDAGDPRLPLVLP